MVLIVAILLAVALAGCQPGGALRRALRSETETPLPVPTTSPTRTPRPSHTPTLTFTPVPFATQSGLGVTPTVKATPTPTARPSSTGPSYPGKLVVRGADGMLYVVNANGTGLRQLTDGIDPSWSPAPPEGGTSGQQIAFVRWREPWGLYVINSDGSGERRLVVEKHLRAPAWSPSGDVIATLRGRLVDIPPQVIVIPGWGTFVVSPGGEVWLHVLKAVNPNSGVYEGDYPAGEFVLSPSWSPDGVHLVYDGARGIYVTAMGEDPRLLTPELEEATNTTPAWSPKGDRIAYVRRMHDHWEIWSMNPAGGDRRRLTPAGTEIGERAYNSVAPAWSPCGRYIAFLTDRESGTWRVYVMRAGGSGQRRLLNLPVKYEFNGDRILDWTR